MISKTMSAVLATLLFVAVSAGMAAIWFTSYSSGRPASYQIPPDTTAPPVVVPIASGSVEVPPGAHRDFPFLLPSHLCRITGHLVGSGTGGIALLLNDTTYERFKAGKRVSPYWDSGESGESKLDLLVVGPGVFHLFVDNESGPSARRPVSVQAQATCR